MSNIFELLFYSTEIWGYLGVLGVVVFSLAISYKVKGAAAFFFIVLTLMAIDYFARITAGGSYVWHIVILMFGAIMTILAGIEAYHGR